MTNKRHILFLLHFSLCVCTFSQQGFSCCSLADWSVRVGLSYHGDCYMLRSLHPPPPTHTPHAPQMTHAHIHTHAVSHSVSLSFCLSNCFLLSLFHLSFSHTFSFFLHREDKMRIIFSWLMLLMQPCCFSNAM